MSGRSSAARIGAHRPHRPRSTGHTLMRVSCAALGLIVLAGCGGPAAAPKPATASRAPGSLGTTPTANRTTVGPGPTPTESVATGSVTPTPTGSPLRLTDDQA